jgi:hypothetical protein
MKKLAFAAFLFGMFALVSAVGAADKDDPVGTWKWKNKFGKTEVERTLKIESVKDGKVTGTVSGFGKDAKDNKIEDGTFKNGELSFTVTVMRKDQKFTSKYNGKVSGDSIKGTITSDFGGKENKLDWDAKREK